MSDPRNVGSIPCPHCGRIAVVREAQRRKKASDDNPSAGGQGGLAGALYIYCPGDDSEPGCGAVVTNGKAAQARIRARMNSTATPAVDGPPPSPVVSATGAAAKPEPEQKPDQPTPPEKKKGGLFGW